MEEDPLQDPLQGHCRKPGSAQARICDTPARMPTTVVPNLPASGDLTGSNLPKLDTTPKLKGSGRVPQLNFRS